MKLFQTHIAAAFVIPVMLSGVAVAQAEVVASPQPVLAAQTQQVAGFYHQPLGQFQVTALYDGYVKLPVTAFQAAATLNVTQFLAEHAIKTSDGVQTAVNAYLVNTGKNLVLVDSGAAKCFGETLGSIQGNLQAAGYQPSQVTQVLLTHLHPDHSCGIRSADGQKAFPNATVYVDKAEADFWLDAKNLDKFPKEKQAMFAGAFPAASAAVAPYLVSGQFKTYQAGDPIVDGIQIVPSHGHTIGHTSYAIESDGARLVILGDVVHNHAIQFEHPSTSFAFDHDPAQAVATRQALFQNAAKQGDLVGGAHLPFPGLGHIRAVGTAQFDWIPVEYSPIMPSVTSTK
jgi:glyoxylase-like metal-dependent hydrolase (beta-lactamase superfamily II)